MSVEALTWAMKQRTGDPRAKVVLICLANYADEDGRCWPSQAKLADQTEQSVDTVGRRLALLEEQGLIRREQRRRPDGARSTDVVVLLMDLSLPLPLPASPLPAGLQAGGEPYRTGAVAESFIDTKDKKKGVSDDSEKKGTTRTEMADALTWIEEDDDAIFPLLSARWKREHGKPPIVRGSRHCRGVGAWFSTAWIAELAQADRVKEKA